jgi:enoyl-CoA hydratase
MAEYRFVTYEEIDDGEVVRILLNRPRTRNAQNRGLLVELDHAMLRAEADDRCRVVILGGAGTMFSAGHDMGSAEGVAELSPGPDRHPTSEAYGGTKEGVERRFLQEWHFYFDNTRRWRNLRKITIAQVHGPVFAAGLMLMWACDLIAAAEGTVFADVVGTRLGMCGVEYFAHPWELGPRRAKELLLTGDALDVHEAHRIGMVNKVFPADRLEDDTLALARRIARLPTVASLLVKESVNQTQDAMGFHTALSACFSLHQVNHAHWAELHDDNYAVARAEDGVTPWNDAPPVAVREAAVGEATHAIR